MDPSGISPVVVFVVTTNIEPEASALQGQRSTPELRAQVKMKSHQIILKMKKKGGDPSAGSPTDTL